jgi:hypothetical protein
MIGFSIETAIALIPLSKHTGLTPGMPPKPQLIVRVPLQVLLPCTRRGGLEVRTLHLSTGTYTGAAKRQIRFHIAEIELPRSLACEGRRQLLAELCRSGLKLNSPDPVATRSTTGSASCSSVDTAALFIPNLIAVGIRVRGL